jgi:hypothetical protein
VRQRRVDSGVSFARTCERGCGAVQGAMSSVARLGDTMQGQNRSAADTAVRAAETVGAARRGWNCRCGAEGVADRGTSVRSKKPAWQGIGLYRQIGSGLTPSSVCVRAALSGLLDAAAYLLAVPSSQIDHDQPPPPAAVAAGHALPQGLAEAQPCLSCRRCLARPPATT